MPAIKSSPQRRGGSLRLCGFAACILSLVNMAACNRKEATTPPTAAGFFTDITEKSKLNFVHDPAVDGSFFYPEVMCSGAAFLDYDNDGDLDIYLTNGAHRNRKDPVLKDRLFRQEKDGTFSDVTDASGLNDPGYGMGVAVGDIDNDGDVDVYVTNYGQDRLYRNNGNGTFTDITREAGITRSGWGSSAVFFDYDRDGWLDIFIATYVRYDPGPVCSDRAGKRDYCGPQAYRGEADTLYKNNGNGTFQDVSRNSGIGDSVSKGLGVVAADFNADGWQDLYVANDQEPAELWVNQRNGTFRELALALGAAVNAMGQPEAGMGIAMGDADADQDVDLLVTHLRNETNTFYRNAGAIGFQDDTASSGLGAPSLPFTGFGTGFFDYDHDGDLDLLVVNGRVTRGPLLTVQNSADYWAAYAEPNLLLENDGAAHFQDVSGKAGPLCALIENSRALAFGDVDNDGDMDVLVSNIGGPARLFRNDVPNKGRWLMIRAIDPSLKRDAIGARITISANGKTFTRLVAPGYSYLSSNDLRVHFGFGAASSVNQISIVWPDGSKEDFGTTKLDRMITLEKGKGTK